MSAKLGERRSLLLSEPLFFRLHWKRGDRCTFVCIGNEAIDQVPAKAGTRRKRALVFRFILTACQRENGADNDARIE